MISTDQWKDSVFEHRLNLVVNVGKRLRRVRQIARRQEAMLRAATAEDVVALVVAALVL